MRHLLNMMAGLKYGDCPVYAKTLAAVRRRRIQDLESFCNALAELPLQAEPGSRHEYSFCADVLGRVCEVVSGKRLDKLAKERLFDPLGMKDTHFVVPPHKHKRVAVCYDCKEVPESKRRRDDPPYK